MNSTPLLAAFVLFLGSSACSDDHSHPPAGKPTCEAIVERCHPLDRGPGAIHECHEFAETAATTEAQCVSRRTECFATCTASDAGADASLQDAASDVSAQDVARDASTGG